MSRRESYEKPLKLVHAKAQKIDKNSSGLICIIHYDQNKSDCIIRPLSEMETGQFAANKIAVGQFTVRLFAVRKFAVQIFCRRDISP